MKIKIWVLMNKLISILNQFQVMHLIIATGTIPIVIF